MRGISPIIGEILLIAIIALAMSVVAMAVLSILIPHARRAELSVRIDNGLPPDPAQDDSFDTVRVVLYHVGGDPLGIPRHPDDEFRVFGIPVEGGVPGQVVPWDNWVFSNPADGFGIGENAVGYLVFSGAEIQIEDEIRITVKDLYADEVIFSETLKVENSLLL